MDSLALRTFLSDFTLELRAQDNSASRKLASQDRLRKAPGLKSLSFESNQGQSDSNVKFISHAEGFSLFLTADGALMKLGKLEESGPGLMNSTMSDSFLRMTLAGGNRAAPLEGLDQIAGRSNYVIGNDPGRWRTSVANYAKVRQQGVYPGVDLIYWAICPCSSLR